MNLLIFNFPMKIIPRTLKEMDHMELCHTGGCHFDCIVDEENCFPPVCPRLPGSHIYIRKESKQKVNVQVLVDFCLSVPFVHFIYYILVLHMASFVVACDWYTSSCSVLQCGNHSRAFPISQGVCQGAILSPLLYSIFVDDLLNTLDHSGLRARIGEVFCSAPMYADNLALVASSPENYKLC